MKPAIVEQIKEIIGSDIQLVKAPVYPDVLTGLMVVKNGHAKYAMAEGSLIGLNLAGVNLTDIQWRTILMIEDFAPEKLIGLNLSNNSLEQIEFSNQFSNLEQLDLSANSQLKDLKFENGLPRLKRLILNACSLSELKLSGGFSSLEFLQAVGSGIKDCKIDEAIPSLEYMDLSENELKNLDLPGGFAQLKYLYFRANKIKSKISFQHPLPPQLNILNLSNSHLFDIPSEVVFLENLEALNLIGNVLKNIPKLFLEKENCIEDARDWFAELRDYPFDKNKAVKLMLTGNGDAGKTTLLCALKNGACEHNHPSTHGIQIETWEDGASIYNTWDFGGQEVYHGTHRLFMSSEAIQLILFTPDVEDKAKAQEKVWDRIRKEKILPHTVEYWYETIHSLSPNSSFILVQNKEDVFSQKHKLVQEYADNKKAELRLISALKGSGIKNLKMFLKTYAEEMPEYDMIMPQSWLNVRQFFIDNVKGEDSIKVIDQNFFIEKCKACKVSERTWPLLKRYLHHSGYIYYHDNLGDKIIADQKWALEAIYKPLDREADHYEELKEDKGKIRVRRLFEIFGDQYDKNQKWLFLQFLKSCGLCFKVKTRDDDKEDSESDFYLFPEFLKDEKEEEVDELWSKAESVQTFRYKLPWLNYHIIQAFITNVGRKTNTKYIWRTGIYVPTKHGQFRVELDAEGKAILLSIEQKAVEHLLLPIIETMGSYTEREKWEVLVEGNFESFNREKGGAFLRKGEGKEASSEREDLIITDGEKGKDEGKGLSIIDDKIQMYEGDETPIYFSYAWRDEENPEREVLVQEMYDSLTKANFKIQRDKEDCGHGEYIDEFMNEIGRGELILVFLSEKYLRSVYCMSELYNISKECGLDKSRFKNKILPIVVEPVDFSDKAFFALLDYWEALRHEKTTFIKENAHRLSGTTKMEEWTRIIKVSHEVSELIPWISNLNRGSIKLYKANDFENIKNIIQKRLANAPKLKNDSKFILALESGINQMNLRLLEIKSEVVVSKEEVISKITSMETQVLESVGNISSEFRRDLKQIFQSINQNKIDEEKIIELNKELEQGISERLDSLPDEIMEQWREIQKASQELIDVKGKFKWNIAIIPGILQYETEFTKTIPLFKWARNYWSKFNLNGGHK